MTGGLQLKMSSSTTMRGLAEFSLLNDKLPPFRYVPPFPGKERRLDVLMRCVSTATDPLDDDWDVISSSGRLVRTPRKKTKDDEETEKKLCCDGLACALAELRESMDDGIAVPPLVLQEGTDRIWRRIVGSPRAKYAPIPSVQAAYGIPASEHAAGIEQYVLNGLLASTHARLVLGCRFANRGFARTYDSASLSHTEEVLPNNPRFDMIWALDFGDIPYRTERVNRFREHALSVLPSMEAVEMFARVVAAGVCQPFPHGFAKLSGRGGNGKGLSIEAISNLYGPLASPFNLAALLGVSRSSSTTNDQSTLGLLSGLVAFDKDAVDPGKGLTETLKKASAGEDLSLRLLQQNVATARATAFMIIATNHGSTLPSTPEWQRRVWEVPFRENVNKKAIKDWAAYLGTGENDDDGIIDAMMAGAVSFARQRPDPVTVSRLTEGLTTYGRLVRDKLMECGPLGENGLPDRPRVPVGDRDLKELRPREDEKSSQQALMGLATASQRDIHGDGRTKQVIYVKDEKRFRPFADEWIEEHRAADAERAADERAHAQGVAATRAHLLDSDPLPAPRPGIPGQIDLLRSVQGMAGTLLTPTPYQWGGDQLKGITVEWQTDETVRHDLRSCDPAGIPAKYALSAAANLLIVDCDPPSPGKGRPDSGLDTLMAIPGVMPDDLATLVMRSQHGLHFIWRLPDDLVDHVKSVTHVHGTQIDLRPGGRAYVLGPGSRWADKGGDHFYPGVVALPPLTLVDYADEASQKARRIPMLPKPIEAWIRSDPKTIDQPQQDPMPRLRFTGSSRPDDDWHVDIPPMGRNNYHDPIRTATMQVANHAKNHGWPDDRRNAEMDRIRAAAAGHDPRDTRTLIDSAISKVDKEPTR